MDYTQTRQYKALQAASGIAYLNPVIVDTETTGLDDSARIVEIAVVDYLSGQTLYAKRVNPEIPIPPEASAVHGITNADVTDCPTWPLVMFELLAVLSDRPIVAYNALYDKRMVEQCNASYGLPNVPNPWLDVMEPYAEFYGEWNEYHGNFRWQKLTAAIEQMAIRAPAGINAHSAEWDAQATRLLLIEMTNRYAGLVSLEGADLEKIVSRVAASRQVVEQAKARRAALVAKFEASPAYCKAMESVAEADAALIGAEADLKEYAEKYYLGMLEKTVHEAAKVALASELIYEEKKAVEWAAANMPDALKIDKRPFEKYARSVSDTLKPLPFVKVEPRLQVRLATDMSKWLPAETEAPGPADVVLVIKSMDEIPEIPF